MSMTRADIPKVQVWLDRMRINADRAIKLSENLSPDGLKEDKPLFWALAKLAENVEESIKQLDDLCPKIYDCLIEIPVHNVADQSEQLSWQALKGMRDRLAHQFWNIDPKILWDTVTEDFQKVSLLLHSLHVIEEPHIGHDDIQLRITREDFERLPVTEEDPGPMKLGHSIAYLYFEEDRLPKGIRIGRSPDNHAVFAASPGRGGIRAIIQG